MIDIEGKSWLIEVNTNPCLEESSEILRQYIPRMLDDAFKLTLDKIWKKPLSKNMEIQKASLQKASSKVGEGADVKKGENKKN